MDICQLCGGPLTLLGQLGNRTHLRCVSCGMESSVPFVDDGDFNYFGDFDDDNEDNEEEA